MKHIKTYEGDNDTKTIYNAKEEYLGYIKYSKYKKKILFHPYLEETIPLNISELNDLQNFMKELEIKHDNDN